MVKSMTGYGRCEKLIHGKKIMVEIKSVNHRFLDLSVKLHNNYSFLEEPIKKEVQKAVSRGKVDLYLYIENQQGEKTISLNESFARSYYNALCQLKKTLSLPGRIDVALLARNNELFQFQKPEEDADLLWQDVQETLHAALSDFIAMRSREGERLASDLQERGKYILSVVEQIEEQSPRITQEYESRLREKISEVLSGASVDEPRILTEVAIFADRVSFNEEVVRLKSHFKELETLLAKDEPVGRKLDFLIQEMNREINTTGSKCNDLTVSRLVVDIKAELEKIREQVQNIE